MKKTASITFKVTNLNLSATHIRRYDGKTIETWAHIYLNLCIEMTQEKIVNKIKDHLIGTVTYFTDELTKLGLWSVLNEYPLTDIDRICNILDIIHGMVPQNLITFLDARTLPTLKWSSIEKLSVQILSYFIELVRKEIWIERYNTLKEL